MWPNSLLNYITGSQDIKADTLLVAQCAPQNSGLKVASDLPPQFWTIVFVSKTTNIGGSTKLGWPAHRPHSTRSPIHIWGPWCLRTLKHSYQTNSLGSYENSMVKGHNWWSTGCISCWPLPTKWVTLNHTETRRLSVTTWSRLWI